MNISLSNILATSAWMAFLSVLAIIGIIVAGGFIVALLGRMVLSLINPKQQEPVRTVDEFGYTNNSQDGYVTQSEEILQHNVNPQPQVQANPVEDYAYGADVDQDLAKIEENQLNKELNTDEDDEFFKDFVGDDDVRFGDDDLLGMVDEISQDILNEEEQTTVETEQAESEANQSILEKYSIDSYFEDEDDIEVDDENIDIAEEEKTTDMTNIVDEQTMDEINALKQQVKEIVENMEENKNQNETFNEQLINILNELKETNKKEVRTSEDAEREINDLKQQLEDSRIEMEKQLQACIADKDAEMQKRLQQQLDESNAEIESLKAQLSELINKMDEPDDEDESDEVKPVEEVDEITALRQEVKEMIDAMREDNNVKNNEINAQLSEILNEMKQGALAQEEKLTIESNEDAIEQVQVWQEELEVTEKELQDNFNEEMLHKDEEEKSELRAQMESYSDEIAELKKQLAFLNEKFETESENAKNKNQALIDQLEAERQKRIKLEQEKLAIEQEQQEQLELLRKENEELIDRIQTNKINNNTLTQEEMDDLYSEVTNIDYNAINKMNEEQIEQKVKQELEGSKQEIDELKEQVNRLTNYIKEREDSLADKMNVHEVRRADFDVEQIKEITSQEVEDKVREKIIESLAEVEILKDELDQTKQEIENQYKEQLANTEAGMEYDRVSKLQDSAEKIDDLNKKLNQVSQSLQEEQENVKNTSEECVTELENVREEKEEVAKLGEVETEVAVIGPKNNKVALVSKNDIQAQSIESIDIEVVKQLTEAELNEIVEARLESSNKEIANLKQEIANLKQDLAEKNEQIEKVQETTVPVVRSPLFDVEMIKTITAQEVEKKVQERLTEAMKEIEAMKAQLELSKQEIERQYKEEIANNKAAESEVKEKLKGSAAEVIELKEQLIDLTEQLALEHQDAKQNSEAIAEQLGQDREMAKQQLAISETSSTITESSEVTVIGPKNNQIALISDVSMLTEEVGEMNNDIPTIDIETVRQLTEQEIEEKVALRMSSSIIEIEELKKQILNLSLQIKEIKGEPADDDDDKPMVFHYSTEEAYLERLAILEERLKSAKKDLKINNKELNPLEKVKRTLERDKLKLRRKYAITAKKKVALYGVNNYVDIDKEKAEKLAQELELLEGLKLSVAHCEEVMNANVDRYPILVHTDKILRENIANIESDIQELNKELNALREKNGSENN